MFLEALTRSWKILTAVFGVCTVICAFTDGPDIARGLAPTPHEKEILGPFSD